MDVDGSRVAPEKQHANSKQPQRFQMYALRVCVRVCVCVGATLPCRAL